MDKVQLYTIAWLAFSVTIATLLFGAGASDAKYGRSALVVMSRTLILLPIAGRALGWW